MYTFLEFEVLVLEAHAPCPSPIEHARILFIRCFIHQTIKEKVYQIKEEPNKNHMPTTNK